MKRYLAAAVIVLAPALVLAQKTSFDFDKTANFAGLKTYTQRPGTPVKDPLVDNRIVAAIDAEMAAKGLTKNDQNPDAVVFYHVAMDERKDITAFNTGGYGGYYGWGGGWGTTDVRVNEVQIGTLIIDVNDARTKAMVWRGMGVKEIDVQAKAEKRDKNISNAVKKIMKNFPPPQKK